MQHAVFSEWEDTADTPIQTPRLRTAALQVSD